MYAPDIILYQSVIWTLLWRASGGAAGSGTAASGCAARSGTAASGGAAGSGTAASGGAAGSGTAASGGAAGSGTAASHKRWRSSFRHYCKPQAVAQLVQALLQATSRKAPSSIPDDITGIFL